MDPATLNLIISGMIKLVDLIDRLAALEKLNPDDPNMQEYIITRNQVRRDLVQAASVLRGETDGSTETSNPNEE